MLKEFINNKFMKHKILKLIAVAIAAAAFTLPHYNIYTANAFIKWVDFNVPHATLNKVYELDVKTHKDKFHYRFTDTLAYIASQNGNRFSYKKDMAYLNRLISKIEAGQSIEDITGGSKYYGYYKEAYNAIFAEYIGYYTQGSSSEVQYGLKAYFPFAQGYWFSGSDDFGNSRSYGFKRVHLGHDLFGSIGTPIIAVEGGIVTELGWNKYGGWRIGIRSLDNLRYYYYAHLRKDAPYVKEMKKGGIIEAGQVIGYLGVTGYSNRENKNMGTKPHLHFGLQLIFDKSQEDGNGEIWIDVYNITRFLAKNRAKVRKNADTKDYYSINLKKAFK
jgi:murein DD-endopeptidase MepM/ murein hydrolase activator NlpD